MKFFLIFILTFIYSCQEKQKFDVVTDNDTIVSMSQITTDYDTLIKRVKYKGNIDAYDELFYGFMDANKESRTDSLMIYSEIMAEKYNYQRAYFDYFKALCEKEDIEVDFSNYSKIDISLLSKSSERIAKGWLKKMLEKKIITQQQYNSIKK